MRLLARHLVTLSLCSACALSAGAVTLDWNINNTFTQGQTNSYNVDPSAPGADISVAIATTNIGVGTLTAAVDSTLEGGFGPNNNTLGILLNLTTTGQYVTVTVTFSAAYTQGVTNVSFTLFDVDATQFQDQIRSITATTINNTTVGATVTGSSNNSVTGVSPNQIVNGTANTASTGATSGDANVTINFGTAAIKSFTFVYGSGTLIGSDTDPTQQKIGLYNIGFTPVPEINPSWSAVISCLAAAGLILRHRAKVRK